MKSPHGINLEVLYEVLHRDDRCQCDECFKERAQLKHQILKQGNEIVRTAIAQDCPQKRCWDLDHLEKELREEQIAQRIASGEKLVINPEIDLATHAFTDEERALMTEEQKAAELQAIRNASLFGWNKTQTTEEPKNKEEPGDESTNAVPTR